MAGSPSVVGESGPEVGVVVDVDVVVGPAFVPPLLSLHVISPSSE